MNKIVITRLDNKITAPATAMIFYDNDKACDFKCIYDDSESILGNIYLGYVKDIVKNINAAFVEIADGVKGYLPLEEAKYAIFANNKNTDKLCQGDKIIVQVVKDRIKTKDYVLSTKFSLAGRYVCLTHGDTRLSISKKIKDDAFKELIYSEFQQNCFEDFGLIFRTNSINVPIEVIKAEVDELKEKYHNIVTYKVMRSGKTRIYNKDNVIIETLRDMITTDEVIIITDLEDVYNSVNSMKSTYKMNFTTKLYDDEYELYKLYGLNSLISEITSKKVWLKSGGYIIIENTEAFTAIDVNTGKYDKGSNKEAAILKINKEAAAEIARQLRLRNISGMIIVDFINMNSPESVSELINFTRTELQKDFIQANVVDITKLGLMEITRKKISEPFILKK